MPRPFVFLSVNLKTRAYMNGKMMNGLRASVRIWSVLLAAILLLPACSDDESSYSLGDIWIAIATVVPQGDGVYYLRLDNGETMWPAATNYPGYRPRMDQRAFVNFTILADSTTSNLGGFAYYVKVNAIHDILTKPIAPDLGAKNDSIYGTDPVLIPQEDNIWVGDGYLNIYFVTDWGGKTAHYINLIQPDPEGDPYTLEFRHNAYDDPGYSAGAGRVAFNLGSLPNTEGETVDLNVKVLTPDGEKIYRLKYNTDKTKLARPSSSYTDESISGMTDLR